MPIYEYLCKECDHCFEYLVFSEKDPVPSCPQCRKNKVKKLISAGCVRPKGVATGTGGFKPPACAPSGG
ncbi:MAG: zinc ribbon domain-containing protein [Deltaproteobacteria bacterium]|nr:zinc ribbon domain-containing protein [Deltaproteobacteria bacterium]